ncbi:MAG: putative oxidoreductase [Frankiales bacterium]|nr:putative oxidoreductase [Frankiales bacterium]
MHAIVISPGGALEWSEVADPPPPGPGHVRVSVTATAVNRADLMQRAGNYPPPPGASPILGLECAGVVEEIGPGVEQWRPGDRVCALLAGGGYAEQVVVPERHLLPVPDAMSLLDAAALPEALCTAWSNLRTIGRLRTGETVLVHGGAGGVGTVALQLARHVGARAVVTTARAEHAAVLEELGATHVVDYRTEDFVAVTRDLGGADVTLDILGAAYLDKNVDALALDGRLVVIAAPSGARAEINLAGLLAKRATLSATTLRNRTANFKGDLVADIRRLAWDGPAADDTLGTPQSWLRPVVHAVLPIARASEAHEIVAAGGHVGKVVLHVR